MLSNCKRLKVCAVLAFVAGALLSPVLLPVDSSAFAKGSELDPHGLRLEAPAEPSGLGGDQLP